MDAFVMPRTVLIVFEKDSTYYGAEVRCRANIPIRDALAMSELVDVTPQQLRNETTLALLEKFAAYVVSWNLVDENNEAVPVTVESVMDQPPGFVLQLFKAWTEATMAVPKVSSAPSVNGNTLAAASVEMGPS